MFLTQYIQSIIMWTRYQYKKRWASPGGPVVRTPRFHCWGPGFDPGCGIPKVGSMSPNKNWNSLFSYVCKVFKIKCVFYTYSTSQLRLLLFQLLSSHMATMLTTTGMGRGVSHFTVGEDLLSDLNSTIYWPRGCALI